jgi:hypothetical protein
MTIFRFEGEASFAFIEGIEHLVLPRPFTSWRFYKVSPRGAHHRVRPLAPHRCRNRDVALIQNPRDARATLVRPSPGHRMRSHSSPP